MRNYKALIIDRSKKTRALVNQVLQTIPEIVEIIEIDNIHDAEQQILQTNPHIIFLDIEMPSGNGIEWIEMLAQHEIQAAIVFLASNQNFILDAIRVSAFDYIIKPLAPEDIRNTIQRFKHRRKLHNMSELRHLIEQYHHPTRIKINTKTGFVIIDTQDILYLQADGTYTEIILTNAKPFTSSLHLGKLAEKLPPYDFMRISRSSCVNLKYVKAVNRIKSVCVLESGEQSVELSISRQYMRRIDEKFE